VNGALVRLDNECAAAAANQADVERSLSHVFLLTFRISAAQSGNEMIWLDRVCCWSGRAPRPSYDTALRKRWIPEGENPRGLKNVEQGISNAER
jgi:hypothetical protein